MSIITETIRAASEGMRVSIDLERRNLRIGRRMIVREGRYEGALGVAPASPSRFFSVIERLYGLYIRSVPSGHDNGIRRHIFKAPAAHELDDESMLYGESRSVAGAALELYILCQSLLGFRWDSDTMGRWYWRSSVHPDLVVLRRWVDNPSSDINNNSNNN